MTVDYCNACDRSITHDFDGDFNYTDEGIGPYCETCWFFIRHIEALRDRVTDIEKKLREDT